MKTAILATLIASAAAFAPSAQKAASTTALSANKYAGEVGVQVPLGFWDPMGLLASEDPKIFQWMREAEVKHGRIAMLAVVGYLTTYAGVRIPGMADVPCGLKVFDQSLYTTDLSLGNVQWTIITMVILETCFMKDAYGLAEFPGDYRNGYIDFGWESFSEETKLRKRAIELNNGRAAMMGIWGLVTHEAMGNVDVLLPLAK